MTELDAAHAELTRLRTELEGARAQLAQARSRGPTYAWCCDYFARTYPSERRKQFSRQRLWQYRAVSRLPSDLGKKLDAAGLGFAVSRYVASGHSSFERMLRAEEVFRLRRLPDKPFCVSNFTLEERQALLLRLIAEAEERNRVVDEGLAVRMASLRDGQSPR